MPDTYGAKAGVRSPDTYPGTQQWDNIAVVSGSDATTTGQSLVDVTGLVLPVVHGATYEFEIVLKTVASADTNGMSVGIGATQTVVSIAAQSAGNTAAGTISQQAVLATGTGTASYNTTSSGVGIIILKGQVVTHATLDGNLSVQHLKTTSGTSTVKVGSTFKIRRVA